MANTSRVKGRFVPRVDLSQPTSSDVARQTVAEAKEVLEARKKIQDEFFGNRLDRLSKIAEHKDEDIQTQTDTTIEDVVEPEPDNTNAPEPVAADEPTVDDPDVTMPVNGKQVTKKRSEWLALATKVENADEYLDQAAKHLQQTSTPVPVDTIVVEDIAKIFQEGSREEVVDAVKKVIQTAESRARQATLEQNKKNEFSVGIKTILDENKDLAKIPELCKLTVQFENELLASKKVFDQSCPVADVGTIRETISNALARYREAWKRTRNWYAQTIGETVAGKELADLDAKKKAASKISGTSTRTNSQQNTVSEKDARTAAVAAMRAHRDRLKTMN